MSHQRQRAHRTLSNSRHVCLLGQLAHYINLPPPAASISSCSRRMPRIQRSQSVALCSMYLATTGCGKIKNFSAARPAITASATCLGRDRLGLEELGGRSGVGPHQHVGEHALRAQARNFDRRSVSDRQPFGQCHGRVLGHGVGRRTDRGQQAGGRRRLQQIPVAALEHRRQYGPCGVDVGHEVDVPNPLPLGVRSRRHRRRWQCRHSSRTSRSGRTARRWPRPAA